MSSSDENSSSVLKAKLATLTENFSVVQNDRAALRAQIASSLSLLGFLRDELSHKEANAASSFSDSEEALLSNTAALEAGISALQNEIANSRKVHSQISQQISDLLTELHATGQSKPITEILHRIDDLNSCYSTLSDLKTHLESQAKPSAVVEGSSNQVDLKDQLNAIENEIPALEAQRTELAAQVDATKAKGSAVISEALSSSRTTLDAEHAKQVSDLKARIAQQAAKRENLHKEIEALRTEANLWSSRLATISAARAEASNTAATVKEELDKVKAQHEAEINALNATLASTQFPLSSYLATVQPIRSTIAESKAQHDAHAKAIFTINKNVASMQHQIQTLKQTPTAAITPTTTPAPQTSSSSPQTQSAPAASKVLFVEEPAVSTPPPAATAPQPTKASAKKTNPKKVPQPKPAPPKPAPVQEPPKPAPVVVHSSPLAQAPPRVEAPPAPQVNDGFKLVTKKAPKEERVEIVSSSDPADPRSLNRHNPLKPVEDADVDESSSTSENENTDTHVQTSSKPSTKKSSKKYKIDLRKSKSTEKPAAPASSTSSSTSSRSQTHAIGIPSAITELFKPLSTAPKKTKKLPMLPPGVKLPSKSKNTPFWQNSTFIAIALVSAFLFIWLYV